MTLILSLASPEVAVQVSDRMVTHLADGSVKNEMATKTVLYCNRIAFGFTGLAELEDKTTDNWLGEFITGLPDQELATLGQSLVERAGQACARPEVMRLPRHQRKLAFVGTGFTRMHPDEPFYPLLIRVTNFQDAKGKEVEPRGFEFQRSIYKPPAPLWGWIDAGAGLRQKEVTVLHGLMRRCAKRGGPTSVVRLFRDMIRTVSDRLRANGKYTVGKDLLVAIIPRAAADNVSSWVMSADGLAAAFLSGPGPVRPPDPAKMPVFDDLPAGSDRRVRSAPLIACPGQGSYLGPLTITFRTH